MQDVGIERDLFVDMRMGGESGSFDKKGSREEIFVSRILKMYLKVATSALIASKSRLFGSIGSYS